MVTPSCKAVHKSHAENFLCEMNWDVATTWQLRGLCDNYGVYVAVTGSMWLSQGLHGAYWKVAVYTVDPTATTHIP